VTPRRLKLIVSYDGRDFAGWQSQSHGNTVQDRIEGAFKKICGSHISVIGAGRTDAGVHALGQCAHVDVPAAKFSLERWITALNGVLPSTIRILRVQFVSANFHARYSAKVKIYRYRIVNSAIMSPFEYGRAWHIAMPLDRLLLERGAKLFVGRHDFASFAARTSNSTESTTRTIDSVRIRYRRQIIEIEFVASGFLYKMVRLITGALVRCAAGQDTLDSIRLRLEKVGQTTSRFVAPPSALYLVRVRY
jgi:tRNA pseudouridine38-40 synthase